MTVLLELGPYAIVGIALGLALTATVIVDALFRPFEHLPLVGGAISSLLDAIRQGLIHALGVAFSSFDHLVGGSIHALADVADWLWREIRAHATALAAMAPVLYIALQTLRGLKSLVQHLVATGGHAHARSKTADQSLVRLRHRVKVLEQDYAKGIGSDVLPRIRSLDREIARVKNRDVPAIQSGVNTAEGEIGNLWQWVKDHTLIAGTTALAGAVALALSSLGLGWVRCSKVGGLGRSICGLPSSLFNDLLGLLADFFVLTNVCTLIPILETVASDVGTPLVEGLTYIGAGLCATGASVPAALTGPGIGKIPVYLA